MGRCCRPGETRVYTLSVRPSASSDAFLVPKIKGSRERLLRTTTRISGCQWLHQPTATIFCLSFRMLFILIVFSIHPDPLFTPYPTPFAVAFSSMRLKCFNEFQWFIHAIVVCYFHGRTHRHHQSRPKTFSLLFSPLLLLFSL